MADLLELFLEQLQWGRHVWVVKMDAGLKQKRKKLQLLSAGGRASPLLSLIR